MQAIRGLYRDVARILASVRFVVGGFVVGGR